MEALDFLKEAKRMCLAIGCCSDCQLGYGCVVDDVKKVPDIVLESNCLVVEQWSKEHPLVTNKMKIREVFGDQAIYAISSPNVQALKDWLDAPYKEPEHDG